MYHGLFFRDGQWCSFGIHAPSPRWTEVYNKHQAEFGDENVSCLYWTGDNPVADVYGIQDRVIHEVALANQVQDLWNINKIPEAAGENGKLHLSLGISLLEERYARSRSAAAV